MATLTDDVKAFIVQSLACFDTQAQVIAAVKQEFGVVVTPQQCNAYSPTTKNGARMSGRLKQLYDETRKRFLEDASQIPIANQTFRLRAMNRLLTKAEAAGNAALAAQLLEQAAKEIGGAFTNRRELTGKGGTPIAIRTSKDLSDDELAAIAAGGGAGTPDPA